MSEQPILSPEEIQKAIRNAYKNLFPNFPDESQVKEFLEAIGTAISTWVMVEMALYRIFEKCIASTRPRVASVSYYTLQHTKSQIEMTDAAVQSVLIGDEKLLILKEWTKLKKTTGEKLERRNKLVHNCVYQHFDKKNKNDKVTSNPHLHDDRYSLGIKDASTASIRLTDIHDTIGCFSRLSDDLNKFLQKIPQQ